MTMQVISTTGVDAALSMPRLIDALAEAFCSDMVVPLRHHHTISRNDADATLLLMPAWTGAGAKKSYLGTKTVTVFPANSTRNLPSIFGSYLLLDGTSGVPLATMDGARLTVWRTAAASALAARSLVRQDAQNMLMVGAGALAPFLIRAHLAVRPYRQIKLWNHRFGRAAALAAELAAQGLPVSAVEDLEAAVRQADLVSCATLSVDPLIKGDWLQAGTHVDCVGAFRPSMRETDDAVIARATLFCDTRAGALKEAGDLAQPMASGLITEASIAADLFDLAAKRHRGRRNGEEITLFKSVGTAIEDLAAAIAVWEAVSA
jgi:ornithine cyclodeaminase